MQDRELKIATWNLDRPSSTFKKPKNDAIMKKLREVDADILVLTETNSCIDLTKQYQTCIATTSLFGSLSIGTGPYGHGENRVTIWSKFPGQRRSDLCNSHSGICALLKCNGWGELNVYGTILGIYGKNRGKCEPDLKRTDFQTAIVVQTMDWERLNGLGSLCIAGDFNTSLKGSYYVSPFGRERLNDCFKRLEIDVPTRDIPDNIDHIAVSKTFLKHFNPTPKWEIWNEARDENELSDHMGICVTLTQSAQ